MSTPALVRAAFLVVVIALTFLVTSSFLRRGFPEAWASWVKKLALFAVVAGLIGIVGWQGPRSLGFQSPFAFGFLTISSAVLASSIALALTSLVWGPAALVTRARPLDPQRRAFLRRVTGAVPIVAAGTGPVGALSAVARPALTEVEIKNGRVPRALDGLTILQLTDVHLGVFIHEDQFQRVVDVCRERGVVPDLVVLTGDIADDLKQLPGALEVLKALQAPLGIFASIGNHEIYRGRDETMAIYREAGVGYLCNDGVVVEKNGGKLWLAGADDPARGLDGSDAFLERTVARAMAGCPDDVACKVLLSHRPRGFVAAQKHGVTLTLSGHTHGAQMGAFGRSLLEPFWPESFLLGHYRHRDPASSLDDTCHLYTSAGLGHWMPFRLNCPCEAVLVTLRSSDVTTNA